MVYRETIRLEMGGRIMRNSDVQKIIENLEEGIKRNSDKGYEIGTMEEAQKFSENRWLDLEKNFVDALGAPENKNLEKRV